MCGLCTVCYVCVVCMCEFDQFYVYLDLQLSTFNMKFNFKSKYILVKTLDLELKAQIPIQQAQVH